MLLKLPNTLVDKQFKRKVVFFPRTTTGPEFMVQNLALIEYAAFVSGRLHHAHVLMSINLNCTELGADKNNHPLHKYNCYHLIPWTNAGSIWKFGSNKIASKQKQRITNKSTWVKVVESNKSKVCIQTFYNQYISVFETAFLKPIFD